MPVVLFSLAAAFVYAVAAVLQQRAASAVPEDQNLRFSLVLALARRPLWLAGITASGAGLVLQLVALHLGSLTVVQPLLVLGLIFALPMNALIRRRAMTGRDWLGAGLVTGGLALFLAAAGPGGGRAEPSLLGWAITSVAVFVPIVLIVLVSTATRGPVRAVLQAGGAGIANGFSALVTKAVAHEITSGAHLGLLPLIGRLLTSGPPYVLLACLAVVIMLVQSAFQSGPIAWSLPALTALNPVAAVAIGVGALHEHIRVGLAGASAEVIGAGLAVAGILALARSAALVEPTGLPLEVAAGAQNVVSRRAGAPASPPT